MLRESQEGLIHDPQSRRLQQIEKEAMEELNRWMHIEESTLKQKARI